MTFHNRLLEKYLENDRLSDYYTFIHNSMYKNCNHEKKEEAKYTKYMTCQNTTVGTILYHHFTMS